MQMLTTSKMYCPILYNIFDRAKLPMISIGDQTPFEAAILANCHFSVAFEVSTEKIRLIIGKYIFSHLLFQKMLHSFTLFAEKLQYRLSGSVVIMCANEGDVKFVSGHLTQANIKCIGLDNQYSRNQISKSIAWKHFNFLLL